MRLLRLFVLAAASFSQLHPFLPALCRRVPEDCLHEYLSRQRRPIRLCCFNRLLGHHRINCGIGYMATDFLPKSLPNFAGELAKNLVAGLTVSFVAISHFAVQNEGPLP